MRRACSDRDSLEALGWPTILETLAGLTETGLGRERASEHTFYADREAASANLQRVEESRQLLRRELAIPVAGVGEVAEPLARLQRRAVLSGAELLATAGLVRVAERLRRFFAQEGLEAPGLAALLAEMPKLGAVATEIESAVDEGGMLRDEASDVLFEQRSRARRLRARLQQDVERLLADEDFSEHLQDRFFSVRGERFVLPIKASSRSAVPGIVHNASQTGQTIFVEPDTLIPLGNELAIAESLAREEEERILAELSATLAADCDAVTDLTQRVAHLDMTQAMARLAERLEAFAPSLSPDDSRTLKLLALRHPLLVLQGKDVVANDVVLNHRAGGLVVSGPNAGGKTVTLTAIGLVALMLRAGLPIPVAAGSAACWYGAIWTAMGDAQDLAHDLSTFSAHLTQLKRILGRVVAGDLVVIDEIAADTDPREGAALARAVLEHVVDEGAQVLVSTHLDEVKALGLTDERFLNASVGFDAERRSPTYRLHPGQVGASNALQVARDVGLDAALVSRAQSYLEGGGALSAAMDALEQAQLEADRTGRALAAEREALALARDEVEAERAQLAKRRHEVELEVRAALQAEFDEAREKMSRLVAAAQRAPGMKTIQRSKAALEDVAEAQEKKAARVAEVLDAGRAPESAAVVGRAPRVGDRVKLLSLGREGEVAELAGDALVVSLGALRMRVSPDDVCVIGGPAPRSQKAPRVQAATPQTESAGHRIDLRGMRVDEATQTLERGLEQAMVSGEGTLMVVHGHGTGVLKRVVREVLVGTPYVSDFRFAAQHEGGEGVTVVELAL